MAAREDPEAFLAEFDRLAALFARARAEVETHVLGQSAVVELAMVALLAGGHALMIGVPGLAKTRLVKTLGAALGLDAKRVQFTPDLIPADILGSEVLETAADGGRAFRFVRGPVFAELLMADEINRASPRTQSALLEAMQEGQVTVAGQALPLPRPFHVLATQNPIEQDGTYPLPEAQLDRFMLAIPVGYPALEDERRVLLMTAAGVEPPVARVASAADLLAAQAVVPRMPAGEMLVDSILRAVRALRPSPDGQGDILWGPGPRGGQALLMAARARAFLGRRSAPLLDDVAAVMPAALTHRLQLTYAARAEGRTAADLIEEAKALL